MTASAERARGNPAAEDLYHEADIAFHRALIAATGNRALGNMTEPIHRALAAARRPLARPEHRLERSLPEHRRILAAIAAGDAAGAREAMRDHLADRRGVPPRVREGPGGAGRGRSGDRGGGDRRDGRSWRPLRRRRGWRGACSSRGSTTTPTGARTGARLRAAGLEPVCAPKRGAREPRRGGGAGGRCGGGDREHRSVRPRRVRRGARPARHRPRRRGHRLDRPRRRHRRRRAGDDDARRQPRDGGGPRARADPRRRPADRRARRVGAPRRVAPGRGADAMGSPRHDRRARRATGRSAERSRAGCAASASSCWSAIRRCGPATAWPPSSRSSELLARADVVSLHLPLTPATRGLIGTAELAVLRPTPCS